MTLTGLNRSSWKENLCQCHFVHLTFHRNWPDIEPGPPRWHANC